MKTKKRNPEIEIIGDQKPLNKEQLEIIRLSFKSLQKKRASNKKLSKAS